MPRILNLSKRKFIINGQEFDRENLIIETSYKLDKIEVSITPIFERNQKTTFGLIKMGENRLVSPNSKEIIWWNETSRWEWKKDICQGIVDKKGSVGLIKYEEYETVKALIKFIPPEVFKRDGYIPQKGNNNVLLIKNEKIARELGYIPSKNSPVWYHKDALGAKEIMTNNQVSNFQDIPFATTHHANDENHLYQEIKRIYSRNKKLIKVDGNSDIARINTLLNGKSFGIEYETGSGSLHNSCLGLLGLVPVRDGSLAEGQWEYSTIPLEGVSGLYTTKETCKRLTEFCTVDRNCALHIHIGNINNDKLTTIALYSLITRIQEDIFNMLPYYKRDERGVLQKQKNYCQRLLDLDLENPELFKLEEKDFKKEIDSLYNKFWDFVSGGMKLGKEFNRKNRKNTPNLPWKQKWMCPTRYYAVNFVNFVFEKSGTIEFRVHSPSLNFIKISNWLLICVAIVRYAEKYARRILEKKEKISLLSILDELKNNFGMCKEDSYQDLSDYLKEYVKSRTATFRAEYLEALHRVTLERDNHGSIDQKMANYANTEFKTDNVYQFSYKDRKTLY
jgi:hypothetical protein